MSKTGSTLAKPVTKIFSVAALTEVERLVVSVSFLVLFKNAIASPSTYSLVRLVWPNTEELISRPFMGLWKIRLLPQDRMRTKKFRNQLPLLQLQLYLQLQQYSLAPMVLVAGFSSGFPMLRTTSICQGTNPCEQKWQIWPSSSIGTMVSC